ncbi:secondary thiamine-phosphate synthase enzyme [Amphritea atlantica]|uniref:Secondary thiamine-phosphate synthase enzyme n=1 Tax=Amphritea atlantica TaxID=355243 RepID=A0A1H9IJU7_9GAMM|nr:secondary thiamine-phosphate synthase enzyme YjbQ [Amphritea atlantica]SEQ74836.1 secondary thiamine-phosphate synthase enzyme [Amphritea atlantica]
MVEIIRIETRGQGLYEFTDQLRQLLNSSGVREGLCTLLIQHTSASLTIQENADPSAQQDLENWLNRLVPEGDPLYTHVFEGRDDMPAHIKAALTATTLSIPVSEGRLLLGTWQGVYCWEHRHDRQIRSVAVHIG